MISGKPCRSHGPSMTFPITAVLTRGLTRPNHSTRSLAGTNGQSLARRRADPPGRDTVTDTNANSTAIAASVLSGSPAHITADDRTTFLNTLRAATSKAKQIAFADDDQWGPSKDAVKGGGQLRWSCLRLWMRCPFVTLARQESEDQELTIPIGTLSGSAATPGATQRTQFDRG
jgi:hypothetical protein